MTEAPVFPWTGMQSRFLASRTIAEQVHIFDLTARTVRALSRWATRFPLIRRERVWPLALSVAAAAPHSSAEALIATARLSLWVFTLDDLFDEERVTESELLRRSERYRAIALNLPTAAARDSLATALREVREDLARYPLFSDLGGDWSGALCGTIDGMVRELEWRKHYRSGAHAALPTYDEYLASGLYSIGGPPHIWAAIITTDDPSTPKHLAHLREMEQTAAICIRLANDMRSYEKEMAEGNINSLVLLAHASEERGLPVTAAYREAATRVSADIARGLDRLDQLQAAARTTTQQPEAAIADIARFVCDFYTSHDYHTFTAERGSDVKRNYV